MARENEERSSKGEPGSVFQRDEEDALKCCVIAVGSEVVMKRDHQHRHYRSLQSPYEVLFHSDQ